MVRTWTMLHHIDSLDHCDRAQCSVVHCRADYIDGPTKTISFQSRMNSHSVFKNMHKDFEEMSYIFSIH